MMRKTVPFPLASVESVDARDGYPLESLFRKRRTPLLLRGLAEKWPAMQSLSLPSLRAYFGDRVLPVAWSRDRNFAGEQAGARIVAKDEAVASIEFRQRAANQIFDSLTDPTNPYYLNTLPIDGERTLLADIPIEPAHSPDFQPLLWVSAIGQVTSLHFDSSDVLFAQFDGTKRFVMFAPDAFDRLYVHSVDHPQMRYSRLLDLTKPDFELFPAAKDLAGYEAIVEPGSVLFTPNYWWHSVFTESPSVSVSFLLNKEPIPRFEEIIRYWEALYSLLENALPPDLPPPMRVYAIRMMLFPQAYSMRAKGSAAAGSAGE